MSPEQREQVRQRMLRARIRLALQQPFLATALMRLPVGITSSRQERR